MSQREFPPVHESVIDLEARLRYENHAKRRSRIHLLILIVSGQVKNRSEAAKHLRVHRNSVYNWLEAYKAGGLEQMLQIGTTGPRAEQKSLPAPVFQTLREKVEGEGFSGYTSAKEWLRTQYGLELPYSTVHKIIRYRLGAKLKRARPRHQKKTTVMPPPFPPA